MSHDSISGYDIQGRDVDPSLKARALAALANPPPRTLERDELTDAYMTAESLKLEGVETSTEEILEVVRSSDSAEPHTDPSEEN